MEAYTTENINKIITEAKEAIEGQYYMVKISETDEFEPAKCIFRGENVLYFRFLNGCVFKTKYVFHFELLNHVSL